MIVAGSSLEVLPVAGLPMQAMDRGAHLLVINNSPTYVDVRADAVLHGNVVDIIPAMVQQALDG
jgi:NAD-dependent deacetylase